MAEPRKEISVLQDGMVLSTPVNKSVWIQNLYKNQANNWETRDGFGVVAEINSSLVAREFLKASRESAGILDVGFQECLGAYLVHTNFNHDQIISVFLTKGNTTGDPESTTTRYTINDYDYFYTVVIYDITTNNIWEQILYTHTSEFAKQEPSYEVAQVDNSYNHGYYETRNATVKKFHSIKEANQIGSEVWFSEFQDRVYFGSSDLPTFVYEPAIFRTPRAKFIHNILLQTEINDQESNPYSEESLVFPLALKDGQFTEAYVYIQQSQLPNFSSATYIANRMVYAAGKTLYFSDPNNPNAIIGEETYTLDLEDDILAIKAWNNNIMVWTAFETAVYQPSLNSSLLSGGTQIILSHKIGIINNSSFCTTDDGIYWSNAVGIYFTQNCFDKIEVSDSISLFFTDYAINPINYYYNQNGGQDPTATNQNPNYSYKLNPDTAKYAHMVYDPQYRQIILVLPKLNLAWILKKGWYLWNFESSAHFEEERGTPTSKVGVTNNLDSPRLLCRDGTIYNIAGKKNNYVSQPYNTQGTYGTNFITTLRNPSFVITEWKRGGGLDRNTIGSYLEDWRYSAGYALMQTDIRTAGQTALRLFFDKLIPKRGKFSPSATVAEQLIDDRTFLLPIRVTPTQGTDIYFATTINLTFLFDNTNWEVIGDNFAGPGIGNVAAILPTERVWSKDGFGILAPFAGSQVTYNNTLGEVIIKFDIANVANPNFNGLILTPNNKNNIIYIPIKQKVVPTATYELTNCPVTSVSTSTWTFGGSAAKTTNNFYAFAWQDGWVNYREDDEQAQFVDWCFKSPQIGIEDETQIKSRGTYATMVSRGRSSDPLFPVTANFPYGLYNSIVGSDYKDYVTQIIDVTTTAGVATDLELITGKNTTRNRAVNSLNQLTTRTFDNNFTFGDSTNVATGNFLVDAQEEDTISTSDSTRGESVNYTMFGFIKNKAEKLILNTLRAVVMPIGGRRRRGR